MQEKNMGHICPIGRSGVKEEKTVCSSDLQFGVKKSTSTTQYTFSMLKTIDHYNFMKCNTFVLKLDMSKAFDRVNYCKV